MDQTHSLTSKSIVVLPLMLITVFTMISVVLIDIYFENTAILRYEKGLVQQAKSGARMLEFLSSQARMPDYDTLADQVARGSRFRVTIIADNGWVIGDSRLSFTEVQQKENYAQRPEILQARESGVGIARRYSHTLDNDLLYAAVRYETQGRKGFFRVAVPLDSLDQELVHQRLVLGGFCFIALLVAALLSLLASRYLLGLVRKEEESLELKVRKRTREIEILQNLGTQLTACNSIEEAREVIRVVAAILLPRFPGTLALLNDTRDQLETFETWNGQWQGESTYSPDQCWALRTGQPHLGDPASGNISCNHWSGSEGKMLCIPLVAQGDTLGVVHFSNPTAVECTPGEQKLASALAEHASLTFANLKLRESLQQQAIRDPLTHLFNRRYLMETGDRQISRASRGKQPLGLLMMDLDYFKKFNDSHGHDIGDFILKELGTLLKLLVREADIPCRYGGEEFTLILPETDRAGTCQVAEKICARIRSHDFHFNNQSYGPITLSIGGAVFPENGNNLTQLFKEADEALYDAKSAGRDRVVMAGG